MLSMDIDGPENITVQTVKIVRDLLVQMGSGEAAVLAMRMYRTETGIRVVVPRSLARTGEKAVTKAEFQTVSDRIFQLIETVLGTSIETMKRTHAA